MPLFYIISEDKYFIKGLEEKVSSFVNNASFRHYYGNNWEKLSKEVMINDPAIVIYQIKRCTHLEGLFREIRKIRRRLRAVKQIVLTEDMFKTYKTFGETIPGCHFLEFRTASFATVRQLIDDCLNVKSSKFPIQSKSPALSARQHEVLSALSMGISEKKIGALFGQSPKTIYSHKYKIFNLLNINNKTEHYRMLTIYRDIY